MNDEMLDRILELEADLLRLQKELDEAMAEKDALTNKIHNILAQTKDAEDELIWLYKNKNDK